MNFFNFFAFLKSLKKGVGSGSISQSYGSGNPDPHQNVTDPQTLLTITYMTFAFATSKHALECYKCWNMWRYHVSLTTFFFGDRKKLAKQTQTRSFSQLPFIQYVNRAMCSSADYFLFVPVSRQKTVSGTPVIWLSTDGELRHWKPMPGSFSTLHSPSGNRRLVPSRLPEKSATVSDVNEILSSLHLKEPRRACWAACPLAVTSQWSSHRQFSCRLLSSFL